MNILVNNYILSREQSKPIIENEKISMIIAGAGSGKSLTIVGKIKYMLDNNLIKPNEVCAITYTNKAANSLKEKIKKETKQNIDTYTFHKLSLKILDKANIKYDIVTDELLDSIIDKYFEIDIINNKILLKIIFNYFNYYIFKTMNNYNKILNSKEFIEFKKVIKSFIGYINSNDLSYKWNYLLTNKKHKKILLIIYNLYTSYLNELNSSNYLDFDYMIKLANKVIDDDIVKLSYKLIIIDEFQDTSKLKLNLIKSIVNKNNSSLCVVGDDYQSIYRFQGCNLSLFLNFNKYFSNVKTYFLNETFRNSQELIDVAGFFVQKNTNQIQKNLISKKRLYKPIKIIYYNNSYNILIKLISNIDVNKKILILSRNNNDINKYLKEYELNDSKLYIKGIKHNITYLTIHSSKGLECEIVIVLNMLDDIFGMPCKLKDNDIISLLKEKEDYPYEEERRLFYVALTRTKTITYLLTTKEKESIFIKEIKHDKNIEIKNM